MSNEVDEVISSTYCSSYVELRLIESGRYMVKSEVAARALVQQLEPGIKVIH
jgi:hypothetical protein